MLSIDVSATSLYLVEGEYKKGRMRISGYDKVATPEGCVKNGMITDRARLADALRESIRKNGFKSKKAAVSVNSSAIITREMTAPETKDREMRHLLMGEIEQNTSTKQEYILDYMVLERLRTEDAASCRVLCIVVPKVMAESYRDLLSGDLGLKAVSMDVVTHTVYRLLCRAPELARGGSVLVVSVNPDELALVLAEGDDKLFYRTMPINITKDVVESEFILSAFNANDLMTPEVQRRQIVSAAVENISKMIQFHTIKSKENPVSMVYLCGDMSDDGELAADIGSGLDVPVERLERPDFIDCPQGMLFSQYFNAVSALIPL